MTTYRYKKMREFLEYVIDWNSIISTEISEERIKLQTAITLSEINETISAVLKWDTKEILDGVGDVLVTYGYLIYLYTCLDEQEPNTYFLDMADVFEYSEDDLKPLTFIEILDELTEDLDTGLVNMQAMCEFLAYAIYQLGEAEVEDYLDRILKSNDSKFIKEADWDEDAELLYVRNKYANKFENITYTTSEFRGNKVYLIRADHGKGKLLKPRCFVEP